MTVINTGQFGKRGVEPPPPPVFPAEARARAQVQPKARLGPPKVAPRALSRAFAHFPRFTMIAVAVTGVWALVVWVFVQPDQPHHAAPGPDTIAAADMPRDVAAMKADSFALMTKYPRDPRARLFRGLYLLEQPDLPAAEGYFRQALRLEAHSAVMGADVRTWTQALLALDLQAQGRTGEAKGLVAPLCRDRGLDARTQQVLAVIKLCQ